MIEPMFYLGDALTPDTFEAAIIGLQFVKAMIGLAIAYIAYRGYRSNESRPMLFLCLGFVLLLGIPFALYLLALAVVAGFGAPPWLQAGVIMTAEFSQIAGLVSVLYALRV